jgi:hypothetical protein
MTSHYKITGRILILPITGSGYSEGNYSKYSASVCYGDVAFGRL